MLIRLMSGLKIGKGIKMEEPISSLNHQLCLMGPRKLRVWETLTSVKLACGTNTYVTTMCFCTCEKVCVCGVGGWVYARFYVFVCRR